MQYLAGAIQLKFIDQIVQYRTMIIVNFKSPYIFIWMIIRGGRFRGFIMLISGNTGTSIMPTDNKYLLRTVSN